MPKVAFVSVCLFVLNTFFVRHRGFSRAPLWSDSRLRCITASTAKCQAENITHHIYIIYIYIYIYTQRCTSHHTDHACAPAFKMSKCPGKKTVKAKPTERRSSPLNRWKNMPRAEIVAETADPMGTPAAAAAAGVVPPPPPQPPTPAGEPTDSEEAFRVQAMQVPCTSISYRGTSKETR